MPYLYIFYDLKDLQKKQEITYKRFRIIEATDTDKKCRSG